MGRREGESEPSTWGRALEIEVAASPEQVWEAIATGEGHGAWLFPAEIEGREGGEMVIHREPYGPTAAATVTSWEPPRRFAFDQQLEGARAPLATEILVEARGGDTCIVRIVSGFRQDGEGWEDLVEEAGEGWRMALLCLRTYLLVAPGEAAAPLDRTIRLGRPKDDLADVAPQVMAALGLADLHAGGQFRMPPPPGAPPLVGVVEHAAPHVVILRASEPCPALIALSIFPMDGVALSVNLAARFYGPDRVAVVHRDGPQWDAWLSEIR